MTHKECEESLRIATGIPWYIRTGDCKALVKLDEHHTRYMERIQKFFMTALTELAISNIKEGTND